MKIKDIQVYILKKDLTSSMRISRGGFTVRRHCIIQVLTDDGLYGLGEAVGNPQAVKALIENCIRPLLVGMNCMEIESIRNKLLYDSVYFERAGSWICATSAIETALWDLKGKYLNCPVYELLGGKHTASLEVYASDAYWYEDAKLVAKDVENIFSRGIKNVKIHTGVLGPKEEYKRFQSIKSVLSSIDKFMIDLNCAYGLADALACVRYFEEFQPYWIEEPLNITSEDQLTRVRSASRIPIAYGENVLNLESFKNIFANKAIDVAMPDVARVGGILTSLEVVGLAQAFGTQVSFHNFSSGVLMAATIHIMAARSSTTLLEYDSSTNSVLHEFFPDGLKVTEGRLAIPTAPGLGVTLNSEVLKFKE